MSRAYVSGYIRDHYGTSYREGIVYLYEAGTTTAAKMYAAETGGSAVYHVATTRQGFYEFWVDAEDYDVVSQRFKMVHTSELMVDQTYDYLSLFGIEAIYEELFPGTTITEEVLTNLMTRVASIYVTEGTISCTVADGKAYFRVPSVCDGMNLVDVAAACITAGVTGTMDIQIYNVTDSQDMLSTKITIDSGETDSKTAAAAAVIDTDHDDVATGDMLRIDVDAIHSGTAAKGLLVEMQFRLP